MSSHSEWLMQQKSWAVVPINRDCFRLSVTTKTKPNYDFISAFQFLPFSGIGSCLEMTNCELLLIYFWLEDPFIHIQHPRKNGMLSSALAG